MRKLYTTTTLLILLALGVSAQQDPMFTKYMFNSLIYNPAYAGSKDHMSIGLLHRTQWWGIEGGPSTQTLTLHSPLRNERVGVGLSAIHDQIGPSRSLTINLSYAYRIPIGNGKLSVGIQGGGVNWRADYTGLILDDNGDEAFSMDQPNMWMPNFGAGIYYYNKSFYMGVGAPKLIEFDLREDGVTTNIWARQYRHYYFNTGAAIPISGDAIIFKPSIMVKNVGLLSSYNKDEAYQNIGAPTEFDIDLSLLFYQALWVGASFRSSIEVFTDDSSSYDSADIWAAFYLQNGLRIGGAFDYTLTELQDVAKGSFEVFLGYEFDYRTPKVVTPRYF